MPECNDSLFQGAVPKHEAVTKLDLGFSFISGLFCLPFYLDCSKFTSVALLKNLVVKPETLAGLVQRFTRPGTAGLQLWPLCGVQKLSVILSSLCLVTGCLLACCLPLDPYHSASLGPSSRGSPPPCSAFSCRSCVVFFSWQTASPKWASSSPPQSAETDQSQPPPLSYPAQGFSTSH